MIRPHLSAITYRMEAPLNSKTEFNTTPNQAGIVHDRTMWLAFISQVHRLLVIVKRINNLFSDVITIYSTLLQKVPQYEDITNMAMKGNLYMVHLEESLNRCLRFKKLNDDLKTDRHVEMLLLLALLVLSSAYEALKHLNKCFSCVEVFFLQFDNLRKLLIPCLTMNARMVLQLLKNSNSLIEHVTAVVQADNTILYAEQLVSIRAKLEDATGGIRRELRILETVFVTLDTSLQHYTSVLLGQLILKRQVEELERKIVARRTICQQAAEHVLSIPLSGEHQDNASALDVKSIMLYVFSLIVAIVIIVIYRFYRLLVS